MTRKFLQIALTAATLFGVGALGVAAPAFADDWHHHHHHYDRHYYRPGYVYAPPPVVYAPPPPPPVAYGPSLNIVVPLHIR